MHKLSLAVTLVALTFLSACGKKTESDAAATTSAPAVVASVAEVAPENALGKTVFGKTCSMCHASGMAGAPKPGDKADWAPRIAQGMELLNKHALEGYTGAKGAMPARGGNTALSDDEVKAAVAYMVDKSR